MASIEESICESIEILVDKAVAEANYDKTVRAVVLSCVDETEGCYKVQYQDSTFQAYACDSDASYVAGVAVYVLIPGNDMTNRKTIIGTVNSLGNNYVSVIEEDAAYQVNGTNILDSDDSTFTLCSYAGTQAIVLYSKSYTDAENLISVDQTAMKEYLTNSSSMVCGGVFRTELPVEQQFRGNYGILFALDFADNATGETVTRTYCVDVDTIVGNPYKLLYDTRQYVIFDIDGENFQEINYISIFCYDFPNSLPKEECVDDIFISSLELSGATRLEEDEINGYSLTFQTLQGTYFTTSSSSTLTIEAQLRKQGKIIDSSRVDYYWFTEYAGVTTSSQYYCTYGGQGWKCLNEGNLLQPAEDDQEAVMEWIPASEVWTIRREDVLAEEVAYKCSAVYDGVVISKTITIKNFNSGYFLEIKSDQGTQFYYDIGNPTLKCYVNEAEPHYTYSWAMTSNTGAFTSLGETPDLNLAYEEIEEEYNLLVADIASEKVTAASSQARLEELENELAAYDHVMRVDENTIYHVDISAITSFATYKCTVYYGELYIGTTSITLLNTYTTKGVYSLVINDGTKVYKYDENGVSPASSAVDSPISIKALTFTLYDNLGGAINDDVIANSGRIEWIVPTTDTMLSIPDSYQPSSEDTEAGTATYEGALSLAYTIANRYDVTKTRNDIYLTVEYQGLALTTRTDLTFVKEGESGTNGTEFTVRLVPNVQDGVEVPKYWIITQTGTTFSSATISHNFTPRNSNRYLAVELFHNENRIFHDTASGNSDEGKAVEVTWEMLQNVYTSSYSDSSCLSVNSSTGTFTFSGYDTSNPANIVKATVTYDGLTYYATFPVVTVRISNSNYNLAPKDGAGFQYATYTSDGKNPKYDNVNPFEVITTRLIDGYWEDVSTKTTSTYKVTYAWSYLGRVYSYITKGWDNTRNLADRVVTEETANDQWWVKPVDSFDGECVSNAVQCIVSYNGTEVGRVHIPVHLMLNRYGLSALNDWDGNSISIREDEGFILSPQVGAGQKESDNSFTGIVIGAVKESGYTTTDVGLIGYSKGYRSIFLDSYTGSARFGMAENGQIVIDPSSETAQIYSGSWEKSGGTAGLCIDLQIPSITYGNGKFSIDGDGNLVAIGSSDGKSHIAGWYFDDDSLWSDNADKSRAKTRMASSNFSATINNQSIDNARLYFNGNFGVDENGTLYAASGIIGSKSNKITIGGSSSSSSSASAIYSGSKTYFGSTASGFYLGTDGISLGSSFSVTSSGELTASNADITGKITASSGTIGGWTIGDNALTGQTSSGRNIVMNSNGSITAGDSNDTNYWSINRNGTATFSNITITGGSFTIRDSSDNIVFRVNTAGALTATSGTIGGWTITDSALTSTSGNYSIEIDSNGSISGGRKNSSSYWYVNRDGSASFNNVSITGTITGSTIEGGTISADTKLTVGGDDVESMLNSLQQALEEAQSAIKGLESKADITYVTNNYVTNATYSTDLGGWTAETYGTGSWSYKDTTVLYLSGSLLVFPLATTFLGNVDVGGTLRYGSNEVATQTWVTNNFVAK